MVCHGETDTQNDIHVISCIRETWSNTEAWAVGGLFWLGTCVSGLSTGLGACRGCCDVIADPNSHTYTHTSTYPHLCTHSLGQEDDVENNGRKRKWELCEDLARIRRLSLTLQQSPALYFHLISLTRLSLKWHLCIVYLPPSLYQAFLVLFFPFPLLSMDRGCWGMQCRKHAHSFASLLPLPSPVSFTIM